MTRGMMIIDPTVIRKRLSLAKKITNEHFEMTLSSDRNINYLWYMYKDGTKRGEYKDFMVLCELNLLLSLGIINSNEKDSILQMLASEDSDNLFLGLMSLENFMKQRIKKHGKWDKKQDVSEEFRQVVSHYATKIVAFTKTK